MNRDFKGVWIDKIIWLDEKLTWMEKLFITEINSLDNEDNCFASNDYFAKFFNLSKGRCSQIINSLIKKEYLKVNYIYEGKEIKKRVLSILDTPIKNTKGGIKNTKGGYLENDKDNNTKNNNTFSNTKNNSLNSTNLLKNQIPIKVKETLINQENFNLFSSPDSEIIKELPEIYKDPHKYDEVYNDICVVNDFCRSEGLSETLERKLSGLEYILDKADSARLKDILYFAEQGKNKIGLKNLWYLKGILENNQTWKKYV